MTDPLLRRTVRRCTALLLVVLGAISIEVATLEYPDGGVLVGAGAIVCGGVYLLGSAFAALVAPDETDADGGGPRRTGPDADD